MSTMISGFVKKTLRKLGLGGRRRKSVKAGRRHRRRGGEEPKMSFAPMQTRKGGRRRKHKGGNHMPGHTVY
jgi:hypothetical protein